VAAGGTGAAGAAGTTGQESSTFKQLKQGLTGKQAPGIGGMLGTPPEQKRSNQNYGGGGPNFRNQTTGGFNKLGVPRRTSG
jgi:hypothetical protein